MVKALHPRYDTFPAFGMLADLAETGAVLCPLEIIAVKNEVQLVFGEVFNRGVQGKTVFPGNIFEAVEIPVLRLIRLDAALGNG